MELVAKVVKAGNNRENDRYVIMDTNRRCKIPI